MNYRYAVISMYFNKPIFDKHAVFAGKSVRISTRLIIQTQAPL